MTKRVLMLMGPDSGKVIDMADADAATGVTDGWARDITTLSQPFDSSGILPMAKWPTTLKAWLVKAWGIVLPGSITVNVLAISKANPTVITVGPSAIAAFNNGDSVTFKSTGTALDSASGLVVASKAAGPGTFTVAVDLSAIPAPITNTGTVTKV